MADESIEKMGEKMLLGFVLGSESWVGEVLYILLLCAGVKRDSA